MDQIVGNERAAKIAALGNRIEDKVRFGSLDIYLPLLRAAALPPIKIQSDIAYGPDAKRHLLDVHQPQGVSGAPVVAFFHGGGMIGGYKNDEGGTVYGNVANFFASHGVVGVNATYRLAPAHPYPAGGEDVGAVVAWLRKNAAQYGGDPKRIFIMGHSAGAAHVATYAFRNFLHPSDGPGIAGAILVSGGYAVDAKNPPANRIAYYGQDFSKFAERQIIGNVERADFPIFVIVAEHDPVATAQYGFDLISDIATRHKVMPRFKQVRGHNHFSEVYALGTGDTSLGPDLIDFVENAR